MSAVALPFDVSIFRRDFPILETRNQDGLPLVYLDNAASTQHPTAVIEALSNVYRTYYANVHRGSHALSDESTTRYEGAREAVRRFIGAASTNEIVFTSGTTAGVNLVARAWGDANVKAGDEILLTEMEHHSNIVPWQQLAERTGCQLKFVPLTDDYELDLAALDSLLTTKTKLFAFTACSNVLGTYNPVQELVQRAHAVGAVTLVDAAQSVPHTTLQVTQWSADFVVFSGHKMVGPSGVGILYGKEALLEAMPPFLGGGSMIRTVTLQGFTPAALPAKFEAGTPPIVPAIGLTAAIEYLENIGLANIHAHELLLTQRAHELLTEIGGIRLLGPAPDKKGGIVSFAVEGAHPHDIAQYLDQRGVAIRAGHHCAMPLHERYHLSASCRASFYLYNTLEEVQAFATALVAAKRFCTQRRK